jgi:NAD(P)H-hydrate epimerase
MQRISVTKDLVASYLTARSVEADKHYFGHALLISGSYGMMGAACLASKAALRSGLGLLTVLSPKCGYEILQTSVPEAMVMTTTDEDFLYNLPDISRFNFIAIGPGLSPSPNTEHFIDEILLLKKKMIIDADAINIIAKNNWQNRIASGSLITPNLREYNRFFNTVSDLNTARQNFESTTKDLKIHVLLKGSESLLYIANKGVYINTTGNQAMAKAGSGDVLCGIILGLWARYQDIEKASIAGIYIHGLAGDIALLNSHQESLIASDIISAISDSFKKI